MSLLHEVRRIYAREHPVFLRAMPALRASITRAVAAPAGSSADTDATQGDSTREWWIVDADGVVLGRLASEVAKRLRGKHNPSYSPHLDAGDHVIVVNASKVVLTASKLTEKQYHRHSGYPGGLQSVPYSKLMAEHLDIAVEKAVKGMLPSNRLGRAMLKRLEVYEGAEHPHSAHAPKPLDIEDASAPHAPERAHTVVDPS